jgi:hypothetical protein
MLWLLIGLLVSLGTLLIAAAGVARHILVQRARLRSGPPEVIDPVIDPAEQIGIEPKI